MLGIWIMIAALAAAGAEARCEIGMSTVLSSEANVALLVTSTGERATTGVPGDPDFYGVEASEVTAWRFRVVDAVVAGEELGGLATLLFVPWGYDAACDLLVWEDEDWVPSGDTAVFIFSRDQLTGGGEPVVHTLGWHVPFPHGLFHRHGLDRADPADWLSAREYFSLLRALPVLQPQTTREQRVAEVLRVFESGPPTWSEKYPGSEILYWTRWTPPPRPAGGSNEDHP